jgi:two-component system chemotaxis response regulator CheB
MELALEAEEPVLKLHQRPPMLGVRPCADLLFFSAASIFGAGCLGVVLTGMGHDGTKGLAAIKKQKGRVLAQDEGSCVVFGMPKAALDSGVVDEVVPLAKMAEKMVERLP